MAARKNKGTKDNPWPEVVKERIQTSMLVNRLQDHVSGKVELSSTQVRAAEILLSKTLPNLAASDNTTTVKYDVDNLTVEQKREKARALARKLGIATPDGLAERPVVGTA